MDELNQIQNPNLSTNQTSIMSPEKHKSWLLMAVIIIIAAGVIIWLFTSRMRIIEQPVQQPQVPVNQEVRQDVLLNQEIQGIDVGNLDDEFQSIDNDLNSL